MKQLNVTAVKVRDKDNKFESLPALRGESTYEIAVRNGFEGTEAEWLENIKYDQCISAYANLQTTVYEATTRANEVLDVAEDALDGVNQVKETADTVAGKLSGCWIAFTDEDGNPTDEPYIHWEQEV